MSPTSQITEQPVVEAIDPAEVTEARDAPVPVSTGEPHFERTTDSLTAGGNGPSEQMRPKVRGMRQIKNLLMLTRQLHVLVSTGTPMVEALAALERQSKEGPWREIVADLRKQLEGGGALSQSMRAHAEYFDSACCSMVAAGESGGNLSEMLERLSTLLEKRLEVHSAILGALVYPSLLTVVALTVLTLLLLFVVPNFAQLFDSMDAPLPPTTQALITMSEVLRAYWWAVLGAVAVCVIGAKEYLSTPAGKRRLDAAALRLPLFGKITRSFATTGLIRMLGTLLVSRVPVLEALRLTRDSATNTRYAELLAKTEQEVSRGESISSSFSDDELIDPLVYESIRTGEKNGQVGPMMLQMADLMGRQNDVILRSLMSIIEPVILIMMGVLVGFVALSMFMPLLDITAMAGGGG